MTNCTFILSIASILKAVNCKWNVISSFTAIQLKRKRLWMKHSMGSDIGSVIWKCCDFEWSAYLLKLYSWVSSGLQVFYQWNGVSLPVQLAQGLVHKIGARIVYQLEEALFKSLSETCWALVAAGFPGGMVNAYFYSYFPALLSHWFI